MIRVIKPPTAPEGFTESAAQDKASLESEYDSDPEAFRSGARRFQFTDVYKLARTTLADTQHGKCAYTEVKIGHVSPEDVEHWRPKGAVRQSAKSPVERPGYYWLAYDWDNLFIVSPRANREYKRDLFPLASPENRARSHHDDLSREEPLLVHPSQDNPEEHVGFRGAIAFPRSNSMKGETTIMVCGLNAPQLKEARRERYEFLKAFVDSQQQCAASSTEASELLSALADDDREYASMVRCAIRDGFKY